MRLCHGVFAVFDDPNLVSCAGLVPVMKLADRCGLSGLVSQRLTGAGACGASNRAGTALPVPDGSPGGSGLGWLGGDV